MRERLAALRDELHESRDDAAPNRTARRAVVDDRARPRPPARAAARRRAGHVGRAGADRQLVARDDRTRASGPARRSDGRSRSITSRSRAHRRRARPPGPSTCADGACAPARRGLGHRPPPSPRHAPLRGPEPRGARSPSPTVVSWSRAQTGHRLHEQVIVRRRATWRRPARAAGRGGRPRRRSRSRTTSPSRRRCAIVSIPQLDEATDALRAALQARAGDRARQLTATLASRAHEEQEHVAATLTELAATIRREALARTAISCS